MWEQTAGGGRVKGAGGTTDDGSVDRGRRAGKATGDGRQGEGGWEAAKVCENGGVLSTVRKGRRRFEREGVKERENGG